MSATQADVFRLYSSMSGVQPAAATCRVSAERPLRPNNRPRPALAAAWAHADRPGRDAKVAMQLTDSAAQFPRGIGA